MTRTQTGDIKTGLRGRAWASGYGWAVVSRAEGRDGDALGRHVTATAGRSARRGGSTRRSDLFVVLLIQRTGLPNGDASPMRKTLQEIAVKSLEK